MKIQKDFSKMIDFKSYLLMYEYTREDFGKMNSFIVGYKKMGIFLSQETHKDIDGDLIAYCELPR